MTTVGTGTLVLHGRGLGGGVAEGEALVTREAISGWGERLVGATIRRPLPA